jgi:hypothetical protein
MEEEGADENFARLQEFVPNAQRIDNVVGIYNVHRTCAERSKTANFWVVDADAWILDEFDFSWEPNDEIQHWGVPESECVHVWPSINPVNKLEYGYGAVKVFPQAPFLENKAWNIDVTASMAQSVTRDIISCETRFNATPKSAWIGAFRECAKMASLAIIKNRIKNICRREQEELEELSQYIASQDWDNNKKNNYRRSRAMVITEHYKSQKEIFHYWKEMEEISQRQLTWCTTGWENKNGKYSVLGAQAGATFGLKYSDSPKLNLINDWDWLAKEFEENVTV